MAITATPLWMEGLTTHEAQDYRSMLDGLLGFKGGLVQSSDFAVTTNNNMTVTVASGKCFVRGTEDTFQGMYYVHSDSNTIVSVDAAHATLNRYDMVVIRIRDDYYATGPVEGVDLFVVKGTPASSPAEPTVPANSFVLARLTVTAADVSIASGDITDRRTTTTSQAGRFAVKGAFRPVTSSTRPTANLQAYGDFIVESDSGRLLWYNGSIWMPINSGLHAYAVAGGSDQTGIGTSVTDVTGASVTVTTISGHRYRITGQLVGLSVTAGGLRRFYIDKDAGTVLGTAFRNFGATGNFETITWVAYDTPTSASHTYKLRASSDANTVTIANTVGPASITVEDIGA